MAVSMLRPRVARSDRKAVWRALKGHFFGEGPRVDELEEKFKEITGVKHAVATNSGSSALLIAFRYFWYLWNQKPYHQMKFDDDWDGVIKPIKTEITTTSMTMLATNLALKHAGFTPKFVEGDEQFRTKSEVEVSYCGLPVIEHEDLLISDQAHGPYKHTGVISCYSFQATKIVHSGDGGMLCTNDDEAAEFARLYRWFGFDRSPFGRQKGGMWTIQPDVVGFKFHMNDITAALALSQLKRLDKEIAIRQEVASWYHDRLDGVVHHIPRDEHCTYYMYWIGVEPEVRYKLAEKIRTAGYAASYHFYPNHMYKGAFGDQPRLSGLERLWAGLITLPCGPWVKKKHVQAICDIIERRHHDCSRVWLA